MEESQMQVHINRMIDFMEMEADELVQKIDAKTEEDILLLKAKEIQAGKDMIDKEFDKKERKFFSESRIALPQMLNRARIDVLMHKEALLKSFKEETINKTFSLASFLFSNAKAL